MKELLAKIRGATAKSKCKVASEVYGHVTMALENLESQAEAAGGNLDVDIFDHALDELELTLTELGGLLSGLSYKEAKRIKENLEKDYQETLEIWEFYELLNPDGRSYTADYAEFAGRRMEIPTQDEVLARLKSEHLKLYQKMEKEGLQPKLQITPIALQISTLGKKIDRKKRKLKINSENTYIWGVIRDVDLQYAPTDIKAFKNGKALKITGGKTKSQWVKDHSGVLIDIIPTKSKLPADLQIQKDSQGQVNYLAFQVEKYAEKSRQNGFTPMSYESYLSAQMRALKEGKPLDTDTQITLLDSNLEDNRSLSVGYWYDNYVYLHGNKPNLQDAGLRWRHTVRIL